MRRLVGAGVVAVGLAFAGSALAADGAALYKSKCTACHGAEGAGSAMAPAHKGNDWVKTTKDADIATVIKNGRPAAQTRFDKGKYTIGMPANKLADDEVSALVTYMKGLNK
ncbi:MAG: cytochrome c [Deltaproteobacteria bacterium]